MLYQLNVLYVFLFRVFYICYPAIDHFYLSTSILYLYLVLLYHQVLGYQLDQLLVDHLEFHLILVLVLEVVHLRSLELNLGLLYRHHLYLH